MEDAKDRIRMELSDRYEAEISSMDVVQVKLTFLLTD